MKKINISSIILSFLICFNALADETVGMVNSFTGDVLVHRPSAVDLRAAIGLKLRVGDIIETKDASSAKLIMLDRNIFTVNENSRLDLREYIRDNAKGNTTLGLEGSLHSEIHNKYNDEDTTFRLITDTAVAGVRGTDFLTEHHNGEMKITTFEGSVVVGDKMEGRKISNPVPVNKGFQHTHIKGQQFHQTPRRLSEPELHALRQRAQAPHLYRRQYVPKKPQAQAPLHANPIQKKVELKRRPHNHR